MSFIKVKKHQSMSCVLLIIFAFTFLFQPRAYAEPMKEFVTSCTYGVLAGTLVGAATLAFTKKPGDNLNNIARGASLGLYAGILLGAYVVYGVPSGSEEDAPTEEDAPVEEGDESQVKIQGVYPLISKKGIEGGAISLQILSF